MILISCSFPSNNCLENVTRVGLSASLPVTKASTWVIHLIILSLRTCACFVLCLQINLLLYETYKMLFFFHQYYLNQFFIKSNWFCRFHVPHLGFCVVLCLVVLCLLPAILVCKTPLKAFVQTPWHLGEPLPISISMPFYFPINFGAVCAILVEEVKMV